MRKDCSGDREKILKLKAEGREFEKLLRSLEQLFWIAIGQYNFLEQNTFLTCSLRFLRSSTLEKLEFKLEKNVEYGNLQEK